MALSSTERTPSANHDDGEWTCPACGSLNYAGRAVCHKRYCGVDRPRPLANSWCVLFYGVFLTFLRLIRSVALGVHEIGDLPAPKVLSPSEGWETPSPPLSSSTGAVNTQLRSEFSWGDKSATTSTNGASQTLSASEVPSPSASHDVVLSASLPVSSTSRQFPQLSASAESWDPKKPLLGRREGKGKRWERRRKPSPTQEAPAVEAHEPEVPAGDTSLDKSPPAKTSEPMSASPTKVDSEEQHSISPPSPRRSTSLPPSKPPSTYDPPSDDKIPALGRLSAPAFPKHLPTRRIHTAPNLHPYHRHFLIKQQSVITRAQVMRLATELKTVLVGVRDSCKGDLATTIGQVATLLDTLCKEVDVSNAFIEPILLEPTFRPVVVGDIEFAAVRAEQTCRPTHHEFAQPMFPQALPHPQRIRQVIIYDSFQLNPGSTQAMGQSSSYTGVAPLSDTDRSYVMNALAVRSYLSLDCYLSY